MSAASHHLRLHELLADRATQCLSPEERDELARLGGLDDVSYDLAVAAIDLPVILGETESMPAGVRDRVDTAAVAWLARKKGLSITREETPRARAATTVWLPWLAAAAALMLAVFAWWPSWRPDPTLAMQRASLMTQPDTTVIAWTDAAALGVTGDVVWNNRTNKGYLRFKGLAVNDPATLQYQLWIFDDARKNYSEATAVDGGVFDVAQTNGDVIVPINAKLPVTSPSLFAITTEPPGGVIKHNPDPEKGYRIILTAGV